MVGQVGGRPIVEVDHVGEVDGGYRYVLIFAELTISYLQLGKIDSSKQLVLAGDRLRIIESGSDEIVEIDVLDVEGLAHVGAARAQELYDLLLVAGAVELCLNRIGRGRHLTERERGGKDFDEDGFHGLAGRAAPPHGKAAGRSTVPFCERFYEDAAVRSAITVPILSGLHHRYARMGRQEVWRTTFERGRNLGSGHGVRYPCLTFQLIRSCVFAGARE